MKKIITVLLLMALLAGCTATADPTVPAPTKPLQQETVPPTVPSEPENPVTEPAYTDVQLIGGATSREEAEGIAELYGITLVEFRNGLARFHTEEDPRDVIQRGEDNGWPKLELNQVKSPS